MCFLIWNLWYPIWNMFHMHLREIYQTETGVVCVEFHQFKSGYRLFMRFFNKHIAQVGYGLIRRLGIGIGHRIGDTVGNGVGRTGGRVDHGTEDAAAEPATAAPPAPVFLIWKGQWKTVFGSKCWKVQPFVSNKMIYKLISWSSRALLLSMIKSWMLTPSGHISLVSDAKRYQQKWRSPSCWTI